MEFGTDLGYGADFRLKYYYRMCDELQKYPEACNILQNNNGFLFRLLKDLLQEFREGQAGNAADDVVNIP